MWAGGLALLVVPLSFLVRDDLLSLIVVFCVGLGLYALLASIVPAVMSELFPTELRATGIGAWYNLTVATFGGTAPLVITALSDVVLPELVKSRAGTRKLRFWSAASSSGQEAFSLAITLQEALPAGWSYEIMGTDISTAMVERA